MFLSHVNANVNGHKQQTAKSLQAAKSTRKEFLGELSVSSLFCFEHQFQDRTVSILLSMLYLGSSFKLSLPKMGLFFINPALY